MLFMISVFDGALAAGAFFGAAFAIVQRSSLKGGEKGKKRVRPLRNAMIKNESGENATLKLPKHAEKAGKNAPPGRATGLFSDP
jgi:hypothetical protein